MYEAIILNALFNPIVDFLLSILCGVLVYIITKNKMPSGKAFIFAYFSGVAVFASIMSSIGIIILNNSNVLLTNLTTSQIISMNHDYGIFYYSTGFAVLAFSIGIMLNLSLGYNTDKKIEDIYQIVKEIQAQIGYSNLNDRENCQCAINSDNDAKYPSNTDLNDAYRLAFIIAVIGFGMWAIYALRSENPQYILSCGLTLSIFGISTAFVIKQLQDQQRDPDKILSRISIIEDKIDELDRKINKNQRGIIPKFVYLIFPFLK